MIHGDIALTGIWFDDGGAAAEVARRQPDSTWPWLIDKGHGVRREASAGPSSKVATAAGKKSSRPSWSGSSA
jgi:hypothetical protein